MGIKEFIIPSEGKAVFAVLLVIAAMLPSSISQYPNMNFDVISQLQLILLLPWYVLNLKALSFAGMILWVVYVYIIASIYVAAYHFIESSLRKRYPQINDRWTKRNESKESKARQRANARKQKAVRKNRKRKRK